LAVYIKARLLLASPYRGILRVSTSMKSVQAYTVYIPLKVLTTFVARHRLNTHFCGACPFVRQ